VRVERDPEWTPDQVALVLGVEAYERLIGPHGQPLDEATSPDSDPNNSNGTRVYVAGVPVTDPDGVTTYAPVVDYAMKAQLDRMDEYRKTAGDNANVNGVVFPIHVVERKPRPQ
jgi:hypothetical protein